MGGGREGVSFVVVSGSGLSVVLKERGKRGEEEDGTRRGEGEVSERWIGLKDEKIFLLVSSSSEMSRPLSMLFRRKSKT